VLAQGQVSRRRPPAGRGGAGCRTGTWRCGHDAGKLGLRLSSGQYASVCGYCTGECQNVGPAAARFSAIWAWHLLCNVITLSLGMPPFRGKRKRLRQARGRFPDTAPLRCDIYLFARPGPRVEDL
jgi:hypothetical protein